MLTYRRFGRDIYAVGGNRTAAIASGIDADRRVRQVYMISGFLAALAGLVLAGRVASVQVNLGEGYIFTIFAAAVIGGVSLQGGRGRMLGVLGGVLLLSMIDRGLNLMRVEVFLQQVVQGLIILFAMFIDAQRVRYRAPVQRMTIRRSRLRLRRLRPEVAPSRDRRPAGPAADARGHAGPARRAGAGATHPREPLGARRSPAL